MRSTCRIAVLSVMLVAIAVAGMAAGPQGVSPGAIDRVATMRDGCTTFSWQDVPSAVFYELVVYELGGTAVVEGGITFDDATEVVFTRVPGGATSWTPEAVDCLAPGGRYAWFVRAVLEPDSGEATEWSAPRLFAVSAAPSVLEVEQALSVLLRYVEEGSQPGSAEDRALSDLARSAAEQVASRSVQTGTAAIRGEQPDPTGETYGVVGVSASTDGGGIGAANTAGGPDLVLDGSADSLPDAELSQSGIDRPWGTAQTFDITNSTGNGMTLRVDGIDVVTTATDQDTPPRDPGNQLNLSGNALDVVEGSGSGLDADTVDGFDSVAFSPLVHLHDDRYYTEDELNTSGAGGAVHWDNLASVPAGFADGVDDNTTYTPGPGTIIDGDQIRVNPFLFREISTLDSVGAVGQYSSVAIGADNLGLISYRAITGSELKVAHCNDVWCTNATVSTLVAAQAVDTSVAIGADGLGLISYFDEFLYDLNVAHCTDVACSSATVTTLDSSGIVGPYTSVAIGADGLGLISYFDANTADLKVAHCNDTTCTSATLSTLDSTGLVGENTSVAIGADGLGLISYYDSSNGDLKVAHCSDITCTTATLNTLDSGGNVGQYTSVAIGADGLGLITYLDNTNDDLKVAHCNDVTCTSATISTLDSAGNVGLYSSVAIGADGLGLISYYDGTNLDVKAAHCSNTLCTTGTVATLDGTGNVGWNTSLAIGADGHGLISYYDATNGDLKVAYLPIAW